jgi:hypothetical protein
MEAIFSSEKPADFQRTTRRYIPEDITLHDHSSENFKFHIASTHPSVSLFLFKMAVSSYTSCNFM